MTSSKPHLHTNEQIEMPKQNLVKIELQTFITLERTKIQTNGKDHFDQEHMYYVMIK